MFSTDGYSIEAQYGPQVLSHQIEVEEHAARTGLSFDDDLHLVGMTVKLPALGMPRQEMSAVNVICNAEFHVLLGWGPPATLKAIN